MLDTLFSIFPGPISLRGVFWFAYLNFNAIDTGRRQLSMRLITVPIFMFYSDEIGSQTVNALRNIPAATTPWYWLKADATNSP